MFVIDKCGVNSGTGGVVYAEVGQIGISTEEIALLLVDH
jgi:hypothetical protein